MRRDAATNLWPAVVTTKDNDIMFGHCKNKKNEKNKKQEEGNKPLLDFLRGGCDGRPSDIQ